MKTRKWIFAFISFVCILTLLYFIIYSYDYVNAIPTTAYQAYRLLGHNILESKPLIAMEIFTYNAYNKYILVRLSNTTPYVDNHSMYGGGYLEKFYDGSWVLVNFSELIGDWTFGGSVGRVDLDFGIDINLESSILPIAI